MESIMPSSSTETTTADQPIEDEQSAIAAQIESFIETNKTDASKEEATPEPATTPAATPEIKVDPTLKPVAEPEAEEDAKKKIDNTNITSGATAKKVIQPISDPTASKGPDLENLLQKEVEKQQMQEIAKTVAAEKSGVAEERSAEAVLKKAAINPATPTEPDTDSKTPQVTITENGDLKVKSEPDPAVEASTQPAPTQPVIPHQNGGNIDGVVSQPSQATPTPTPAAPQPQASATPSPTTEAPKPANDPDSIAL
jgi:hypothetical protein